MSHLDFDGATDGTGVGDEGRILFAADGWLRIDIRSAVTSWRPRPRGTMSASCDMRSAVMDDGPASTVSGRLDGEGAAAGVGATTTGGAGGAATTTGGGGGGGGARYDSGDTLGPVGTGLSDRLPKPRSTREISSMPM